MVSEFTIPGKLPNSLSPNGRAHWRTVAAEKKQWRNDAINTAKKMLGDHGAISISSPTYYHVIIGLTKRQFAQQQDADNYSGNLSLKQVQDGLAYVLTGGDDSRWYRTGVEVVLDPENVGFIRVEIE